MAQTENLFDYYFNLFYAELVWYAFRFTNDKAIAEDVVEEAYITLWEKGIIESAYDRNHQIAGRAIRKYLYTCVRNACLNRKEIELRKKRKLDALEIPETDNSNREKEIMVMELVSHVRLLIDTLPEGAKRIFQLMYIEGLTAKQTAGVLNLSISTIKNQKARGLEMLRKMIESRKKPRPEKPKIRIIFRPKYPKEINQHNAIVYHFRMIAGLKLREIAEITGDTIDNAYYRYKTFSKACNKYLNSKQ